MLDLEFSKNLIWNYIVAWGLSKKSAVYLYFNLQFADARSFDGHVFFYFSRKTTREATKLSNVLIQVSVFLLLF